MKFTKMNKACLTLSLFAVLLMISSVVFAAGQFSDNYKIESDVISGGGGESSTPSGSYTSEHTTGQSVIGYSNSDNYKNYAGFWHAVTGAPAPDTDGDGVPDNIDNCYLTANPGQWDTDSDGYGNMCDADLDNNGNVGISDFNVFKLAWFASEGSPTYNADADLDSNGNVGISDFNIFKARWFTSGPWY